MNRAFGAKRTPCTRGEADGPLYQQVRRAVRRPSFKTFRICEMSYDNSGPVLSITMKRAARSANKLTLTIALCVTALAARADKVRILESPAEASQARIDLIQQAKHSIDAQYYIVGNDYFTLAGLALLRDAARRGCRVRLIIEIGRAHV